MGEAFQLRDDLLDVYGDEALMGKRIGEDLREGKPTPLLAATVARCSGAGLTLLDRVGSPDLTVTEVDAIRDLMDEVGARTEIETAIERLVARAVASLEGTPLTPEAHGALVELASFVATRTH